VKVNDTRYECRGRISIIGDDTVEITELPLWMWTQKYKESVIEPMYDGADKHPQLIQDYKE
jgi:DNA topoisomerase-2